MWERKTAWKGQNFIHTCIICIYPSISFKEEEEDIFIWTINGQTNWFPTCTFGMDLFPPPSIFGYCFSELPKAMVQHLRSPRPTAWLLIATLHLCHMNSWWDISSLCGWESISTQVKMLGLPRSSQKPLVLAKICLAAVPWCSGKGVYML